MDVHLNYFTPDRLYGLSFSFTATGALDGGQALAASLTMDDAEQDEEVSRMRTKAPTKVLGS